ncbi:MAG: ribulose 1,5-bisphosphate carboxylase large subunit [Elusimicrobia bacterium CG11_big_fil_rev_8_21_14_0_20_64_6]|nr:MAG: ribulose 1,5-bisphosphate carboxylase large subunit [Elusimicrobia bacterium CG11_big_fil_rev_8_21_14_0_20_64_6]
MSERLIAVYEVHGPMAEAEKTARAISFEETVEVPFEFPLPSRIREGIVGQVGALTPLDHDRVRVEISFPAALAGGRIGSLLNLVFGNASIWPGVRLVDIKFPDSFLSAFSGPNYGVAGLRALLGVNGRPLLATALKPMGSTEVELAQTAASFARGGGDIVKDDQNIVDASFAAFRSRVSRIADAVAPHNCLYFPHLSGPQEELSERLRFVLGQGLKGVLICPAIVGLDAMRALADSRKAVFMAHPAYSGAFYAERSHGIEHSLYLGTMMRLAGADITVFPNAGGRFAFTPGECRGIAERGRVTLGGLAPMMPAPGGGMNLDNTGAMAADFGVDAVWLVGGRLLMHPGGPEAGARAFRSKMTA